MASKFFDKILAGHAATLSINLACLGLHALRVATATNAPTREADIAKVPRWQEHATIAITPIGDHLKIRPKERPSFKLIC